MSNTNVIKRMSGAVIVACAIGVASDRGFAQSSSAVLLVIDKESIEYGVEQYQVPPDALNEVIAGVGVRDPLPFFASNVGRQFYLRTGFNGNDSWFGFNSVPASWASEGAADDGLQNFALAGPGLGSPDHTGDRESLLQFVPGVSAVQSAGANRLIGRTVCAVIYDNDLSAAADGSDMSLKGANLGLIAFRVGSVINVSGQAATALVQILDVRETCAAGFEVMPQPSM